MTVLLIGIFAGLGAGVRYLANDLSERFVHGSIPWGTYGVNLSASFLVGLSFSVGLSNSLYLYLATGFCGGLSTFSTFNFELFLMLDERRYADFCRYFTLSYGIGFLFCLAGIAVGRSLY